MRRLIQFCLVAILFALPSTSKAQILNVTVTATPTPIVVDRNAGFVLIRENSATPTATFSVTLANSSVAQNFSAGQSFVFQPGTPFVPGTEIGTIVATSSGPYNFAASEISMPPINGAAGVGGSGLLSLTVTNTPTPIITDTSASFVFIRENSASPSAVFSITINGVTQNFAAGQTFTFQPSTPYLPGTTIGTIVATAAGPFNFTGSETLAAPAASSGSTAGTIRGTANQIDVTGGAASLDPNIILPNSTLSLTNPGTFSNTQSYSTLASLINGCNDQSIINETQFRAFYTNAGLFCASGPTNSPGSNYLQTNGIMALATASGIGSGAGISRAVAGYFQSNITGNNTRAFGINPNVTDIAEQCTGTISGTTYTCTTPLTGPQNPPGTYVGIVVGQTLFGTGITGSPVITAFGTGTGGAGTYTITNPNSITTGSETILSQFTGEIMPNQENDTEVYGSLANFSLSGFSVGSMNQYLYNFGPGGTAGPANIITAVNEAGAGNAYWGSYAKINPAAICPTCVVLDVTWQGNGANNVTFPSWPIFDAYTAYWTGSVGTLSGWTGFQAITQTGVNNPPWDALETLHQTGSRSGPSGQTHSLNIGNNIAYAIEHSDYSKAATNPSIDAIVASAATGGQTTYTLPGATGTFDVWPSVPATANCLPSATTTYTKSCSEIVDSASGGAVIGSPTGGAQGTGTLNATGLFVNGIAPITAIQNGAVTVAPTSGAVNFAAGTNITLTTSGNTVTVAGTASTAFSALTGSANTTAAMLVGTGASLNFTGSGTINASTVSGNSVGTSGATIPLLNAANTFSGANTFSSTNTFSSLQTFSNSPGTASGAYGTLFSGAPITSTLFNPVVYISGGGTTPTWSNTSPMLAINAPSGYSATAVEFGIYNNGNAEVLFTGAGGATYTGSITIGASQQFVFNGTANFKAVSAGLIEVGTGATAGTAGSMTMTNLTTSALVTTPLILPGILYSAAGTPLPSCASGIKGQLAVVSDATTPTYMGVYTSGGGITTAVICSFNGSTYSWLTK